MKKAILFLMLLCCGIVFPGCQKSCEHRFEASVVAEASCTATGERIFRCTYCGETYTEEVPESGHQYESEVTKAASCKEKGVTTYTCTMCGDVYTEEIKLLPHTVAEAVVLKEATCVAEGEQVAKCMVCGKSGVPEKIPKKDHVYTEEIIKQATCSSSGRKILTCSLCGEIETETVAVGAHSYGKNNLCTECGHKKEAGSSEQTHEHNYKTESTVVAGCFTEGKKTFVCVDCGYSYTETEAPLGHDYGPSMVAPPSCDKGGELQMCCLRCGSSYTQTVQPGTHDWAPATCTEAKHCTSCGKTEGSPVGHTTKDGICGRCGEQVSNAQKDSEIKAENERHSGELSLINSTINTEISQKERTANALKQEYGIGSVSGRSYYENRISTLLTDIADLNSKLHYTTGAAERRRLEKQIESLQDELEKATVCLNIVDMQEEIEVLEARRDMLIAQENRIHEEKLLEIEKKYR